MLNAKVYYGAIFLVLILGVDSGAGEKPDARSPDSEVSNASNKIRLMVNQKANTTVLWFDGQGRNTQYLFGTTEDLIGFSSPDIMNETPVQPINMKDATYVALICSAATFYFAIHKILPIGYKYLKINSIKSY